MLSVGLVAGVAFAGLALLGFRHLLFATGPWALVGTGLIVAAVLGGTTMAAVLPAAVSAARGAPSQALAADG